MSRVPRDPATLPTAESEELVGLVSLEEEDNKSIRWALVIAIAVHLALLSLDVPGMTASVEPPEKRKVFVVKPIPYQKPPPERREVIPRELPRRVPIPDPTPDDPEPLLPALPDAPVIDVPADLVAIGNLPPPPPPISTGPVEFSSAMVRPVRISGVDPQYTEMARRVRREGIVILRAVITRDGVVRDVEIVKALGFGLEDAAAAAVENWRFKPATLDGKPVAVIYQVTVQFSLQQR